MTTPAASSINATPLRARSNPKGYDYLFALPDGYDQQPTRTWPLLLFLHGAGERGADVWSLTRQGLPKLLVRPPELSAAERAAADDVSAGFIVVAPQCPAFEVWNDDLLLALLDDVALELRVDPARIYFTGLSLGGFGVWSLGMRHPDRFAALVPICGGGRVADVSRAVHRHPSALQRLGIWAFHGAQDRVVPLEESQRMVDAVKAAGVPDVRFTVYPEAEHDSWTPAYATRELYAWLLQHRRE
jgi:predicted peptidase